MACINCLHTQVPRIQTYKSLWSLQVSVEFKGTFRLLKRQKSPENFIVPSLWVKVFISLRVTFSLESAVAILSVFKETPFDKIEASFTTSQKTIGSHRPGDSILPDHVFQ